MAVHCAEDTSRRPASAVIIRSSAGPAREFALCEVEVQVAPVPCDLLLDKGWTIHGRVVLIFPPGEASRAKLEDAGEACERAGGSFVETRSRPGRALCVEAACAPSRCLEEFDTEVENFAPLTVLGLWNHDLERVADECGDLGHSKARMFEATVMIYNGGHPDVGGSQMTTHWCLNLMDSVLPVSLLSWPHNSVKESNDVTVSRSRSAGQVSRLPATMSCSTALDATATHQEQRWSLATSAPLLHDVWAKARDVELTRFTYHVPGRTLGPFLRAQSSPTPHRIVADKSTKELFEACASREEEVYFYSGLAEGAGGLIHEDVQNLVRTFSDAVRAVAAKSLEAKANVWISCPLTGASAHYDMGHNVVIQIFGVKAFDLLPPSSLQTLPIPPTGHPYARQAMNDTGSTFSTITLQPGDALYLPPLWAHRTSSGAEGLVVVH
ncbi:ppm2 [Symbiodinium necroappetens]|uniref:Ppm2 protein n=1 Tax=Symbiodinium necroappetens TaxID=1628268 RepID=A0A812VSQ2_9DINO|nr:ppm2 [Symbiodinium necroappetens]